MTLLSLSAFVMGQAAESGSHWGLSEQDLWPCAPHGDEGG